MTEPEGDPIALPDVLATFRECGQQLQALTDELFPVGCIVLVSNPRFHGVGEVRGADDCPLDKLPVLVESGNTWWYELETIIERVPVAQWPRWIRQSKLRSLMSGRTVKEEELMIEVERLKAWLYKIKCEAYKETKTAILEWLADQAIIHSHCAVHPDWGTTEELAKLGAWPPATIVERDGPVAG